MSPQGPERMNGIPVGLGQMERYYQQQHLDAIHDKAQALRELRVTLDRQNELAEARLSRGHREITRAIADLLSSQLEG